MENEKKCCNACLCPGNGYQYEYGAVHAMCSRDFCHDNSCQCHLNNTNLTSYFKVETKTSFWKHPFKWWHDRKMARLMEKLIDYRWKNGGEVEFERCRHHHLNFGHLPNGNPCKICKY